MNKVKKEYFEEFAKTMKVGLVATIDDEKNPHITLLPSIMAQSEDKMMFGEFVEGLSKKFIQKNNKAGFLIMSVDKNFWNGRMNWESKTTEGEDYIMYNKQPMYRYNCYCGISKVHYLNLYDINEKRPLDMGAIIKGAIKIKLKKAILKGSNTQRVLKPWAEKLMSKLDTVVFISYIDDEGYPYIVPIIQAQAVSSNRIVLTDKPYTEELSKIKPDSRVAVFGMSLDMENVLVKGVFSGFAKGIGTVDIDKVYNSMPPKHGYIYPIREPEPVKEF